MCRNTIFTYKRYIADHDEIDFKKGQIMKKNYSGNNSRSYKNRILKTTLGITLAAMLVVQGAGTGMHMGLSQVAAAEQTDNAAKLKTVYVSGSGKKSGDGTSKDTAVSSFEKAKSLAADSATILVCGTITISGETKLTMPSGITVKRADGFSGPIIKVEGSGKLTLSYGWLSASDVDTKSANLGTDAFVVGEKAKEENKENQEQKKEDNTSEDNSADKDAVKEDTKEESKEQAKEEQKEEPKEETPVKKQEAPAVTVPDSMTMKEPATLESMFMGDGFNGDGTFRFAEPEKVPDTYESTHQIIFTPNDTETYDYSGVPGWSAEGQQVVRSVTVYVESLKAPEPSAEEKEEPKKEEAGTEEPKQDTDSGKTDQAEKPADDKDTDADKNDTDKTEKPVEDKKDAKDKKEDASKREETQKEESAKKDDASKKEESSKKENTDKKENVSSKKESSEKAEKEPVGSLWDKATDVKVSGDFIPSYVEVRVSLNTDVDSLPAADIEQILQAYEIELWDLKADKEYKIPDGKKVTVSIPVPKDADLYKKLVIGHYMEETGSYEYFTLGSNMNVSGGYLVFETGSLSPFNVGGSQLVGIGTQSPNHKPTVPSAGTTGNGGSSSINKNGGNNGSSTVKKPTNTSIKKNNGAVVVNPRTGDESPILTYVLVAAAAVIVVVVLLVLGKRKKK